MDARSKTRPIFDRSKPRIVGLNPASDLDLGPRFSVLCCPL